MSLSKLDRELDNLILLTRDLSLQSERWQSLPVHIEISSNSLCNLRCIMCPDEKREKEGLSKEELSRFCDLLLPYATLLTPSANSEPLLGDLQTLVEACARHEAYLDMFTNATVLTGELFQQFKPYVYRLQVSVDSPERDVYEKIRRGASFERVTKNIREVSRIAEKDNIELVAVLVLLRENLYDLERYLTFVRSLGITSARILRLIHRARGMEDLDPFCSHSPEEVFLEVSKAKSTAEQLGMDLECCLERPEKFFNRPKPFRPLRAHVVVKSLTFLQRRFPGVCPMLLGYFKVEPDGGAFPCCRAPRDFLLGNLHSTPLEEIWNGPKIRELRGSFFRGRLLLPCRDCSARG